MVRLFNFWPPFLGAGVRIRRVSADFKEIDVELKLRWWNRNYVKTHFGGTLFGMTDPFYMVMLIENLGRDYIVWDKAAQIRFRRPGRGTVRAEFRLAEETLQDIRRRLETEEKLDYPFSIEVKDREGQVVCEVVKTIYVRRKKP